MDAQIMTNETNNENELIASGKEAEALAQAVDAALGELVATPEDAPKPKGRKAKQKTQETKPEDNPEETKQSETKMPPAVPNVGGFELRPEADPTIIANALEAAQAAAERINSKDADLLGAYLEIGKLAAEIAPAFKSMKVYGQALAKLVPASQSLDPALRSNCKWLHEALHATDSDLLVTLNVNRLEDYKSANPTVIRREYKAVKDAQAEAKEAEEAGLTVEELEAKEKADKETAAKNEALNLAAAIEAIADRIASGKATKATAAYVKLALETAFKNSKRSEMIAALYSSAVEANHPAE